MQTSKERNGGKRGRGWMIEGKEEEVKGEGAVGRGEEKEGQR